MNDDEYREFEEGLSALLRENGMIELDVEEAYQDRFIEGGARRALTPKERVIAKLEAIERYLALRDRETYKQSIMSLQGSVASRGEVAAISKGGRAPRSAFIERSARSEGTEIIRFRSLPKLTAVRSKIMSLRTQFQEDE